MNHFPIRLTLAWSVVVLVGHLFSHNTLAQGGYAQEADQQNVAVGETTPSEERIQELIAAIHDERSSVRIDARNELVQMGAVVIQPLETAILQGSRDEQMRIMSVLNDLALNVDKSIAMAARNSMLTLARSGNATAARVAASKLRRLGRKMQETAIDELKELGAKFDGGSSSSSLDPSDRYYSVVFGRQWTGNPQDLSRLLWIENPTTVTLIGPQFTDDSVEAIAQHPKISFFRIKDASITNGVVKHLAKMERLARLQFFYCDIDDDCTESLRTLNKLDWVSLLGTKVTAEGAANLQEKVTFIVDYRRGAFMGVNYEREATELKLTNVVRDSAAEQAGIRAGDVLIRYEDKEIKGPEDFRGTVSENHPGDTVTVVVRRDGQEITKTVTLGKYPDSALR